MPFEPFFYFMRGIHGKLNNHGPGSVYGGQDYQHAAFLRRMQKEMRQDEVLDVPLTALNVVVFDFETTGFFPEKGDEIISIGAVRVCGGEIQEDPFYSLVRYEQELSSEIEILTGLTREQLKDAPLLSEVLIRFFHFTQHSPLVAHHANHEKSFLQHASWKLFRTQLQHRIVDTSFLYRIAEPSLKLVRLEDLCNHNDISIVNRHHALGDAMLTAQLWSIYIEKVNQLGCKTLRDVYHRLAR